MSASDSQSDLRQDLEAALQAVETVLARQSDDESLGEVSEAFSLAVRSVVHLRNRLTREHSMGAPTLAGISLDRINALISVMASIEYPLAGIHWPRIQQVRDGLKEMLPT